MKKCCSILSVLCLLAALMSGCASSGQSPAAETPAATQAPAAVPVAEAPYTYADTIAWDGEYDVIVVGFGGAGANAAKYAADTGASVLLTEKAPKGKEGGNTRVCGQIIQFSESYEDLKTYHAQLNEFVSVDEAMYEVYLQGIVNVKNQLREDYGIEQTYVYDRGKSTGVVNSIVAEYPEFDKAETIQMITVAEGVSNGALWNVYEETVTGHENIDVWYESPGKHLIQDPGTKTILGVQIEKQGKLVNIRAKNGVVLATGGFENNTEMKAAYLGYANLPAAGGLYNTGDGILMAQEVGAGLWHMNSWESSGVFGGTAFPVGEDEHAKYMMGITKYGSGSVIYTAADGSRMLREDENTRHGKIYLGGSWHMPVHSEVSYMVFDQTQYEKFLEANAIPEANLQTMVSASTIEALAEATGMHRLAETVRNFNYFAEAGVDYAFGRSPETMTAFDDGPYYAVQLNNYVLNTQGGPRRNENAEVLDTQGSPIPHLYSAGELGGITGGMYQGGGNMAECLIFGKIAGVNAAEEKAPLPAYSREKVESSLIYTLGIDPDGDSSGDGIVLGENEYLGVGSGMGGDITVKVTLEDGQIVSVDILSHQETKGICEPALEGIPAAIVQAQSADVDTVSGATMSSNGIIAAVKDALSKAA